MVTTQDPHMLCFEMISLADNVNHPGRRVSVRDCPDHVGLWVCLWRSVLIMIIDVRRPGLRVGGIIAWLGLDCRRVEKAS